MGQSSKLLLCALAFTVLMGGASNAAEEGAGIKNPLEGRADLVDEGKSLFNQYCSHCHGPDAEQGERVRDLRRLTRRYGTSATQTFFTTINNGRMDKGMPVWKGILSEDVMWRIYTFLQSVQAQ